MYADKITAGRKRSVYERLDTDHPTAASRIRPPTSKRLRQSDDKWKHDLYREVEPPQISRSIGPQDLRLKLRRKVEKDSGPRDLREKLSGTVQPQPSITERPKPKPVSQAVRIPREPPTSSKVPIEEVKKVPKQPSTSKKTPQQKSDLPVDGFLKSLGLEKYSITFQAEEVDMAALMHMTEDDLKALGIPMGPRKKIILALGSKAYASVQ